MMDNLSEQHPTVNSVTRRRENLRLFVVELVVGVAVIASAIVAVLSSTVPLAANYRGSIGLKQVPVYVGSNTCFTCHDEQPHEWSPLVAAQTARPALVHPRPLAPEAGRGETARLVEVGSMVDAYTVGSSASETTVRNQPQPHYLIKTEDGLTLPLSRWDVTDVNPVATIRTPTGPMSRLRVSLF